MSQSILEHGTVRLDGYGSYEELKAKFKYRVQSYHGHTHYYFPVRTPLLATPFVGAARLLSMDMMEKEDDYAVQRVMSLLTVSAMIVLVYLLLRRTLAPGVSGFMTVIFVGGTTLTSRSGNALWSFNFEIIFILCALHLLFVILERDKQSVGISVSTGACLFLACLCRPSAVLFVAGFLLLLLFKKQWKTALIASVAIAIFMAGFTGFSFREFGMLLPPYYQLKHLENPGTFWTALYGNLLSPARGLIVFSPFLIVVLVTGVMTYRKNVLLLSFVLGWVVLELVAVSNFWHWWGGWSYGPRLLTDCIPVFLLITVVSFPHLSTACLKRCNLLLLITGIFSIAVHSGQGLCNTATWRWNAEPNIDKNPHYLFDWRYPQFAASGALLDKRLAEHDKMTK